MGHSQMKNEENVVLINLEKYNQFLKKDLVEELAKLTGLSMLLMKMEFYR